jgi:hypothetical protein
VSGIQQLLESLFGIQVTILALGLTAVFALAQINSNRYSPRVLTVLMRSAVFRLLVAFIVILVLCSAALLVLTFVASWPPSGADPYIGIGLALTTLASAVVIVTYSVTVTSARKIQKHLFRELTDIHGDWLQRAAISCRLAEVYDRRLRVWVVTLPRRTFKFMVVAEPILLWSSAALLAAGFAVHWPPQDTSHYLALTVSLVTLCATVGWVIFLTQRAPRRAVIVAGEQATKALDDCWERYRTKFREFTDFLLDALKAGDRSVFIVGLREDFVKLVVLWWSRPPCPGVDRRWDVIKQFRDNLAYLEDAAEVVGIPAARSPISECGCGVVNTLARAELAEPNDWVTSLAAAFITKYMADVAYRAGSGVAVYCEKRLALAVQTYLSTMSVAPAAGTVGDPGPPVEFLYGLVVHIASEVIRSQSSIENEVPPFDAFIEDVRRRYEKGVNQVALLPVAPAPSLMPRFAWSRYSNADGASLDLDDLTISMFLDKSTALTGALGFVLHKLLDVEVDRPSWIPPDKWISPPEWSTWLTLVKSRVDDDIGLLRNIAPP